MKLTLGCKRRFTDIASNISDTVADTIFGSYNVSFYPIDKFVDNIDKEMKENWTTKQFRELWSKFELANFFSSWLAVSQVKEIKMSQGKLKKFVKTLNIPSNQYIVLELCKEPQIFLMAKYLQNTRTLVNRASVAEPQRDSIIWMPQKGIVLFSIKEDQAGKEFLRLVQDKITGEMKGFRIRSLVISKFFNETKMVTRLDVNAEYQITGFQGLSKISFEGDHVRLGLHGLHKRQDIRVQLDQVGPNVGVASDNLHLKIGPKLMIKNLAGIDDLVKLFE